MSLVSPRGWKLVGWEAVFTIIVLLLTGLRFYTISTVKRRPLHAEDYFIIISVLSLLALEGTSFWAIHNGLGTPTADLQWDPSIAVQFKFLVSATWTWPIGVCSCKMSLLFLYLRLFNPGPYMRVLIWGPIGLNAAYIVIFIAMFNTLCSPYWAAWDEILSVTNCRPIGMMEIAFCAVNLALDCIVVLLPIPSVLKLQMPKSKKIAVCAMFSLGLGVAAVLSWRLYTLLYPPQPYDFVWSLYIVALQYHLELYLGIIAANLPILGPLLKGIVTLTQIFRSRPAQHSPQSTTANLVVQGHKLTTFGSGSNRRLQGDCDEDYLLTGDGEVSKGQIYKTSEFGVSLEPSKTGASGTLPAYKTEITHTQSGVDMV